VSTSSPALDTQAARSSGHSSDQRRVLLGGLVHLVDRPADLTDPVALFLNWPLVISPMMSVTRRMRCRPPRSWSRRPWSTSCGALLDPFHAGVDQALDFFGGLGAAAGQGRAPPLATTAKPRPCSPARAASTAALSARMLVWKAMPSITPMMSADAAGDCVDALHGLHHLLHHLSAAHGDDLTR